MEENPEAQKPIEFTAMLRKAIALDPKHAGDTLQFEVRLITQEFVPDVLLLPTRLKQQFRVTMTPLAPVQPEHDLVVSYQMPMVGVK